jgi:hypothetical protein
VGLGIIAFFGITPSPDGAPLARCFAPFTGLKNHTFPTMTRYPRVSLMCLDIRWAEDLEVVAPELATRNAVDGTAVTCLSRDGDEVHF